MKTWLVTGGAGFIGSNFILSKDNSTRIINFDKLTYAGNPANLDSLKDDPNYVFVHGDINNRRLLRFTFNKYHPDTVIHFAAESHVDRSIINPNDFIHTNIVGTFSLLEEACHYWKYLGNLSREKFRFIHISTDEVYGSLAPDAPPSTELSPYEPHSPYSASKASSDHLVRAYHTTYGIPAIITNCSNNYGPYQFPEKLIPLMILNALEGKSLPIYGDGKNIRDWLYVEDHTEALQLVLEHGKIGETYNIGGSCEKTNLEVVETICDQLDQMCSDSPHRPHASLITFVKDRLGHDRRYAIDSSKIKAELGWECTELFNTGLSKTIQWYINHPVWVENTQKRMKESLSFLWETKTSNPE